MRQVFIVLTLFFFLLLTPFLKKRPKWMMPIAGVGVAFVVAIVLGAVGTFLGQNDDDLSSIIDDLSIPTIDFSTLENFSEAVGEGLDDPTLTPLERQLFGALLTVEDFPAGWSISYRSPFSLETGIIAGVKGEFTDGFDRSIVESVSVGEPGVRASDMDGLMAKEPCWEQTAGGISFDVCRTPFPVFGDQTLAFVGTAEDAWTVSDVTLVYIRRGDVLVAFTYRGSPEADMDWLETLVRRADEKLAALEATGAAINR